jgi:hypothetical protein
LKEIGWLIEDGIADILDGMYTEGRVIIRMRMPGSAFNLPDLWTGGEYLGNCGLNSCFLVCVRR